MLGTSGFLIFGSGKLQKLWKSKVYRKEFQTQYFHSGRLVQFERRIGERETIYNSLTQDFLILKSIFYVAAKAVR